MNDLVLASHDALEHVLPHRFGDRLMHWSVNWTSPFNIVSIKPHDTYFTNHLLMTLVAAVIMLLIFPMVGRRYAAMTAGGADTAVPRGFTNLLEAMLQFVRNEVARPVLADKTDRFMPFLWTVFFFILTCNLLGLVPFDSVLYLVSRGRLEHMGGTATGNIMVTGGLALCAFIMIHLSGAREVYMGLRDGTYGHHHHEPHKGHSSDDHGLHGEGHAYGLAYDLGHNHVDNPHPKGKSAPIAFVLAPLLYVWNFAPHVFKPEKSDSASALIMWGFDVVMWVILMALELIGALIKPFALAIRLFANMVAGHVVLASILALVLAINSSILAYAGAGIVVSIGAAALSLLELFVAFLQAYVFTFLTTLFIAASVAPEH